jgi:hypothetical protein
LAGGIASGLFLAFLGRALVSGAPPSRRAACAPGDGAELTEVATSPEGRRALLLLTNGGATTDFGAEVCVEDATGPRLVAVGYHSGGAHLRWVSDTELRIEQLARDRPPRTVDVTSGAIACEPVRADWSFCEPDGTRKRR